MDVEKIKLSLTNIKPSDEKILRIENVRGAYKTIVDNLGFNCKDSRELSLAVTNLEQSLMWAVKSIILND
jgi:hypothetical protein